MTNELDALPRRSGKAGVLAIITTRTPQMYTDVGLAGAVAITSADLGGRGVTAGPSLACYVIAKLTGQAVSVFTTIDSRGRSAWQSTTFAWKATL